MSFSERTPLKISTSAIMSIIKEGWIEKKGQTFMAGYRKRWLVLYSDQTLKYFEDTYYEILKGSIDISEASKVQKSTEASKNWKFGWEIITPNRSWYFSSKSEYGRKQWIQQLQTVQRKGSGSRNAIPYNNKNRSLQSIAKQQHSGGHLNGHSGGVLRDESPNPLIAVHSDSTESKATKSAISEHFGDTRSRTSSLETRLEKAKENTSVNAKSDRNSKISKDDEYTPGMYSHFGSTGRTNRSDGVTSDSERQSSQFGKGYKYMSSRSMTEIMNKRIILSVNKQQSMRTNESKLTINDRFTWKQYQSQIDDLIHDDENMADDLNHRLDDLKSFWGGHLQKKKWDEGKQNIICQVKLLRFIFNDMLCFCL